MQRRTLIAAALFGYMPFALNAQTPSEINPVFQDGEWLQYKAKFGMFRLGTVRLHVRKIDDDATGERYRIDLRLDSNPKIFFVKLHESHYNIVHPESLYSEKYYRSWIADGDSIETTRRYDPRNHTCSIREHNRTRNQTLLSLVLHEVGPYFEGPSFWLFTRSKVQTGGEYTVQNILDTTVCETSLSFKRVRSVLKIDAFDERIVAREVTGVAHWVGASFGGLNGEFRAWFTDDEAAIPLRAQFKIFVGNVVLELERWHRPGWKPPTEHSIAKTKKQRGHS